MAGFHIKKGDTVKVLTGKDRGKSGKVVEILSTSARARVEGVQMVKRHIRKGVKESMPEGGIIEKLGSVAISNLMVVCPSCGEASRTQKKEVEGKRARHCKKCDAKI